MTVQTGPGDYDPWLIERFHLATIFRPGLVRPDGVSILVDANGVISTSGVSGGSGAGGFLVGLGPPGSLVGATGNVYLDTAAVTNNFWTKTSGVWMLLGTLAFTGVSGGGGGGNNIPYLQLENGNPLTTEAGDDFTF